MLLSASFPSFGQIEVRHNFLVTLQSCGHFLAKNGDSITVFTTKQPLPHMTKIFRTKDLRPGPFSISPFLGNLYNIFPI